jgi:hypothetical protein
MIRKTTRALSKIILPIQNRSTAVFSAVLLWAIIMYVSTFMYTAMSLGLAARANDIATKSSNCHCTESVFGLTLPDLTDGPLEDAPQTPYETLADGKWTLLVNVATF